MAHHFGIGPPDPLRVACRDGESTDRVIIRDDIQVVAGRDGPMRADRSTALDDDDDRGTVHRQDLADEDLRCRPSEVSEITLVVDGLVRVLIVDAVVEQHHGRVRCERGKPRHDLSGHTAGAGR